MKFGDAQLTYRFLHDYSLAHRWLEPTCGESWNPIDLLAGARYWHQ